MNTKAVRLHGKNDLRLDEITLPEVGPDDVQVKIICDSVCMSTYKAALEGEEHKRVPNDVAENPTIMGHEFCGDIIAVAKTGSISIRLAISLLFSLRTTTKVRKWLPAIPTTTAVVLLLTAIFLLKRC